MISRYKLIEGSESLKKGQHSAGSGEHFETLYGGAARLKMGPFTLLQKFKLTRVTCASLSRFPFKLLNRGERKKSEHFSSFSPLSMALYLSTATLTQFRIT